MPICYWSLCHCPDVAPCPEHDGLNCSILNGKGITSETEINDATTAGLEAFVLQADSDAQKLAAIKARIEAQKADLEREKADIEQQVDTARNRSERRAVLDRAEKAQQNADRIRAELLKVNDELDALATAWQAAITKGSGRLILPYADTTGYCACYDRKKQRLSVIAGQIAAQQAIYGANLAALNAVRAPLSGFMTYQHLGGGVVSLIIFAAWVWLGAFSLFELKLLLVAVLVVAIALAALLLYMLSLRAAMLAALRQIAVLTLLYYRLQQIPTCVKAPNTTGDEEWFHWFFDWVEKGGTTGGG